MPSRPTPPAPPAPAARLVAAIGVPVFVGALLAGRGPALGAPGTPTAWLSGLAPAEAAGTVADLPIWADELRRMLPVQPDPILSPLAAGGIAFPALLCVAACSLVGSALFLLLLARLAGVQAPGAGFVNALTCALHLKVLVLVLHLAGDRLAALAPTGTLEMVGGPRFALLTTGALGAVLLVRSAFATGLARAAVVLGFAAVLPVLFPCLLGIAAPFVLAPLGDGVAAALGSAQPGATGALLAAGAGR